MHSETVILFRQHCGPIVTIRQPAGASARLVSESGRAAIVLSL
jgi:hypothetical protein